MSATWLGRLVRARQAQQDAAQLRLAEAERIRLAAHRHVHHETERLEALTAGVNERDVSAFVAAAVALQAAAATHAAARNAAQQADEHSAERREQLRSAAIARQSADELKERADLVEWQRASRAHQRDLDEVAAEIHRRTAQDGS